MTELTEETKYFLKVLESLVSPDFDVNIQHHGKAIRDIMDQLEGHLYKRLNSNGRYDHGTLRYNPPHMSLAAYKLKEKVQTKTAFFAYKPHREHAKPFSMIVREIGGLKGQNLIDYILSNVKSVTILQEEKLRLDRVFKTTMPNPNDVFSRFKAVGIDITEN